VRLTLCFCDVSAISNTSMAGCLTYRDFRGGQVNLVFFFCYLAGHSAISHPRTPEASFITTHDRRWVFLRGSRRSRLRWLGLRKIKQQVLLSSTFQQWNSCLSLYAVFPLSYFCVALQAHIIRSLSDHNI
jgi:hypothetical protein